MGTTPEDSPFEEQTLMLRHAGATLTYRVSATAKGHNPALPGWLPMDPSAALVAVTVEGAEHGRGTRSSPHGIGESLDQR